MYVFYDTETTGLDDTFSQIVQIALVFTDSELNILEAKKLECRRSPWVIPSPASMLITGFSPDDLKNNPLSHYEMMKQVDEWARAKHWPLTFVGYNNLFFDEKVLANNLHQNLLPDSLTSEADAQHNLLNGRADIFTMLKAAMIYKPTLFKLDELNEYGSPSLTLTSVAKQNGVVLSEADAHDAMNDIKATLGVANIIRKGAPELWEHLMNLTTPKGVDDFLRENDVVVHTRVSRGKETSMILSVLGEQPHERLAFNLAFDPAPFLALNTEQLATALKKRYQTPFNLVFVDEQPILMPLGMAGHVLAQNADITILQQRAHLIKSDSGFIQRLNDAIKLNESIDQSRKLPEQQRNAPIPLKQVKPLNDWIADYHTSTDWQKRVSLLDAFNSKVAPPTDDNETLRRFLKFGGRIAFEHAPQLFDEPQHRRMMEHIAARVLNPNPDVPYMTISKARQELGDIEKDIALGKTGKWGDVTESQIRSLKLYYTAIEKEYAPYLPVSAINDNVPVKQSITRPVNKNRK